jgi:lon-related putative ATP-dependent protease
MTTPVDSLMVAIEDLSWQCDPALFDFETTANLPCLEETLGQERALAAIDFGLGMQDGGYNIFILGEPGTGRSSAIRKILGRRAVKQPVPDDWCYVNNFQDNTRPLQINLAAGNGRKIHRDMENLVVRLAEEIPKVFESKEYEKNKNEIAGEFQEKNRRLFQEMDESASEQGFILQRSVNGLVLVPVRDGNPLTQQDFENLNADERSDLDARGTVLQGRLNEVHRQARDLEKEMRTAMSAMEKEVLLASVGHLFEELCESYAAYPKVIDYFDNCKKDILERIDEFRPNEEPAIKLPGFKFGGNERPTFERYKINLLLDNHEQQGAPVIYEANPTYFNLFGRIDHMIEMGNAVTNFTMIKAGALHRANGGYLILDCRELLLSPFSYDALKRAIRNREIKIEDVTEQYRFIATVSLKPEAVPLNCKIIIIGTPELYYLLHHYDPDFRKFFKTKAEFDGRMDNSEENARQYASFVAAKCSEETLLPFAADGVARIVDYSVRLIADKKRLSSRFLDIADLIREASFFAGRDSAASVARKHVDFAGDARIYRSNQLEQRIQELIDEGTLLIDTTDSVVGQVNGLSVYQLADYSFGRPSRVTVRTYLGRSGVINIEREVKLSGPIHDKGVLILTGYLGDRFAQDKPLSLAATICFEQSYSGVEGDSASSTELYALLSSLANVPIRQGIAVTGSVNQRGQIQPIGGANEKIEGFFAVCKNRGLDGTQGVIIPIQNVQNLLLKEEVVNAVRDQLFTIWAVASIDQGMEILTGIPAGVRQEDGSWTAGSINAQVDNRLREMYETLKKSGVNKDSERND